MDAHLTNIHYTLYIGISFTKEQLHLIDELLGSNGIEDDDYNVDENSDDYDDDDYYEKQNNNNNNTSHLKPLQKMALENGIPKPIPIWGKCEAMLCVHDGNMWLVNQVLYHLKLNKLIDNDTCNSITNRLTNIIDTYLLEFKNTSQK